MDFSQAPAPPCARLLWERPSNYCLLQSKGLAIGRPLSLLPWQCCTVIDKVDKEMLGHAPDRLDLKSSGWGTVAARQHTGDRLSPDNQRLPEQKKIKNFGSSVGAGKNVIFRRFVCLGLSCL